MLNPPIVKALYKKAKTAITKKKKKTAKKKAPPKKRSRMKTKDEQMADVIKEAGGHLSQVKKRKKR